SAIVRSDSAVVKCTGRAPQLHQLCRRDSASRAVAAVYARRRSRACWIVGGHRPRLQFGDLMSYLFSTTSTTSGSRVPSGCARYVIETGVPGLRDPHLIFPETSAV